MCRESTCVTLVRTFNIRGECFNCKRSYDWLFTDTGALYTWGRGSFGRLGLGSKQDQWIPKKVGFKAKFRRRTPHVRNRMQMRKVLCPPSLAYDSGHVKCGAGADPEN